MWYPGATPPKYLDGSMPGDYGFDPLRLGANAASLPYYAEAERQNGRWAMAAVVGVLFVEATGTATGTDWLNVGASEGALGSFDLKTLIAIQAAFFGVAEALRYNAWKANPAGPFIDPAGQISDEKRVKEIKNGRLAMLAYVGFVSQALNRGMGPIACLQAHMADPWHNNIYTSGVGLEATFAAVALACVPSVIEAQRMLGGSDDEEFRPLPF